MDKIFKILDYLRASTRQELIQIIKDFLKLKIDWLNSNGLVALSIGFLSGLFVILFWKLILASLLILSLIIIFIFLYTPSKQNL